MCRLQGRKIVSHLSLLGMPTLILLFIRGKQDITVICFHNKNRINLVFPLIYVIEYLTSMSVGYYLMSLKGKKRHCRRILSVSMSVFLLMPLVACVGSVSVPQGKVYTPQQQQQQQHPENTHSHEALPYSF
jgi:hypothetical protein